MSKNDRLPVILHIAECAGGVDRYLEMLLPLLGNDYRQVFLCSKNYKKEKYESLVDTVIQIGMRQTFAPWSVFKTIRRVRRKIRRVSPDIVYCHSSFAGALGRLACIGMGIKVVYNPHGWAFNMQDAGAIKKLFYIGIERLLAKMTDIIVCISEAEYNSAIAQKVCGTRKLRVIRNGINIRDIEQALPVSRVTIGFSDKEYVVGMIGRLMPQKAPDVFIRAARLIKMQIPQAVFIIVGSGDETEQVVDYARENGLRLVVTGWVDNPYAYLKVFDVAMLLSRWEGFGLSIAEYMVARKPVVATRVDAIPTLIEDGVDGLLVDVDSPEEVCKKTIYIYNHHKETEMMKEKAYQKAVRQFDIHRVATQHIGLFADLGGVICRIDRLVPLTSDGERRAAA